MSQATKIKITTKDRTSRRRNSTTKQSKDQDQQSNKLLVEKQRELDGKLKNYEVLVESYAKKQHQKQQQKEHLEVLAADVKKERLKCRALECDNIIVQNENEIIQKKFEIMEHNIKATIEKYGSLAESITKTKGNKKQIKKNKNSIKEALSNLNETENLITDLLQEIDEKTRAFHERTAECTSVRSPIKSNNQVSDSYSNPESMPSLVQKLSDEEEGNASRSEPTLPDTGN